ncbi:MTH1187 family thiamine-binding protein [soil metagenome]
MVVAEISIAPLGTESTSVSRYVAAAVESLESSGLKCSLGPMGTTVEAESREEIYAALAKAQAAVFALDIERAYTVVKMDERRDSGRSSYDMVSAVRDNPEGAR